MFKTKNTYKPKQKNILKLRAFLNKISKEQKSKS